MSTLIGIVIGFILGVFIAVIVLTVASESQDPDKLYIYVHFSPGHARESK